jgi:hypothetical protein
LFVGPSNPARERGNQLWSEAEWKPVYRGTRVSLTGQRTEERDLLTQETAGKLQTNSFLFSRLYFLEQFLVLTKIKRKIQRFPTYSCLPPSACA